MDKYSHIKFPFTIAKFKKTMEQLAQAGIKGSEAGRKLAEQFKSNKIYYSALNIKRHHVHDHKRYF